MVEDRTRRAKPEGPPPAPGAQWDELHGRWEQWDAAVDDWVVVGDDPGDGLAPAEENPLPPHLARELQHAEDLPEREHVADVERRPEPPAHVKGAQWNEVEARWERWDAASDCWVEVEDRNA